MAPSDFSGSGSPFSADGAPLVRSRVLTRAARFHGVLFEQPARAAGVDGLEEPDFFVDLNLDQVLEAMTAGREQYELEPFFYAPLHDSSRRALPARGAARPRAARGARRRSRGSPRRCERMREHLAQVAEAPPPAPAAGVVPGRRRDLLRGGPRARRRPGRARRSSSRGLRGLRDYIAEYARRASASPRSRRRRQAQAGARRRALRGPDPGRRVTVTRYEGEPDYSAEVERDVREVQAGRGARATWSSCPTSPT